MIKKLLFVVLAAILLPLSAMGYTVFMGKFASGTPPKMADAAKLADLVRVDKSERRLDLLQANKVIRSYQISLGSSPIGHKQKEGDERTPVGSYEIDWRNGNSMAHLSLHISYPNKADQMRATANGDDAGGDIMIHGIANGWGFIESAHQLLDWTNGCIAVTNQEMKEIWSLVPTGTPIEIKD